MWDDSWVKPPNLYFNCLFNYKILIPIFFLVVKEYIFLVVNEYFSWTKQKYYDKVKLEFQTLSYIPNLHITLSTPYNKSQDSQTKPTSKTRQHPPHCYAYLFIIDIKSILLLSPLHQHHECYGTQKNQLPRFCKVLKGKRSLTTENSTSKKSRNKDFYFILIFQRKILIMFVHGLRGSELKKKNNNNNKIGEAEKKK